jgi:hypothetical protein
MSGSSGGAERPVTGRTLDGHIILKKEGTLGCGRFATKYRFLSLVG